MMRAQCNLRGAGFCFLSPPLEKPFQEDPLDVRWENNWMYIEMESTI